MRNYSNLQLQWPLTYESCDDYIARQEGFRRNTDRFQFIAEYTAWRNNPENYRFAPRDTEFDRWARRKASDPPWLTRARWLHRYLMAPEIALSTSPWVPPDPSPEHAPVRTNAPHLDSAPWHQWRGDEVSSDERSKLYFSVAREYRAWPYPLPYESWSEFWDRQRKLKKDSLAQDLRWRAIYNEWFARKPYLQEQPHDPGSVSQPRTTLSQSNFQRIQPAAQTSLPSIDALGLPEPDRR